MVNNSGTFLNQMCLYVRFLDPLYHGDYPDIMKKTAGSKLPKFSNSQSEQLINSVDFVGVNYYSIMYVKDDPQAAPSNERDFLADTYVKTTCELHAWLCW
jgi:beta-glucosidase